MREELSYSRLLEAIYDGAGDFGAWEEILSRLRPYLGGTGAYMGLGEAASPIFSLHIGPWDGRLCKFFIGRERP
jgi:hypothetical protein